MNKFKCLLSVFLALAFGTALKAEAAPALDRLIGIELHGRDSNGPCSVTIRDHATDSPNYGHRGLYLLIRQDGQSHMLFNLDEEIHTKFASRSNPIQIRRDRESMANGDISVDFGLSPDGARIISFTGFMTGWYDFRRDFNCRF
jgi:hypothetical protein